MATHTITHRYRNRHTAKETHTHTHTQKNTHIHTLPSYVWVSPATETLSTGWGGYGLMG